MEEILYIIYGNHPKSKKLHGEAAKIINFIREKHSVSRDELASFLNIDLRSQNGKKHFYNLISPMFDKVLVSEHHGKTVYYHLSYDLFRVYLDNIRRKAKYYLMRQSEDQTEEEEE
ncbi:MAG: hypothetical protein M1433_01475 [Candidatus Parvarchaeota archaeon]|nr:hypothetical protein [Candidatus Parvarchaeota archaeon]